MNHSRKIHLLPPEIVHRIAAGEVVDKPASILKELVENSVDAGARTLRITLAEGGLRSIQVEDDGCGMSREDLESCVQRHATSKISRLEDLDSIHSLGFRGEALSAASSVGKLTLDTYQEGSGSWMLRVLGGRREALQPSSRKMGTRVTLEDLFFNVPARRKFLRKPGLEAHDCLETLEALALSHPQIEFFWTAVDARGEVKAQRHCPVSSLAERLQTLTGQKSDLVECVLENPAEGVVRLALAFFKPPASSQTLKSIRLDVNGRPILDKRLPYVVREAFSGLIEVGRFPFAHIHAEVDPTLIDVNIHPQKKEIRWSQGFNLGSLVYSAIRRELNGGAAGGPSLRAPSPSSEEAAMELGGGGSPVAASPRQMHFFSRPSGNSEAFSQERLASLRQESLLSPSSAPGWTSPETTRPPFRFAELRVIGEASASWILCEAPEGVVVIDQHAAHERINFEKQMSQLNLIRSKPLFLPIRLRLPIAMRGSEVELRSALESVGFECADPELLPEGEMELIAVPEADRQIDWDELLENVMRQLGEGMPVQVVLEKLKVKVAASLACHGSVRRGQRLSHAEIGALLKELDTIQWGGLCPHGRPVWFLMSQAQMEALFHR